MFLVFLTAASCPKKDFYTPTPPPRNVQHTFLLRTQKSVPKSRPKKVGKKRHQKRLQKKAAKKAAKKDIKKDGKKKRQKLFC